MLGGDPCGTGRRCAAAAWATCMPACMAHVQPLNQVHASCSCLPALDFEKQRRTLHDGKERAAETRPCSECGRGRRSRAPYGWAAYEARRQGVEAVAVEARLGLAVRVGRLAGVELLWRCAWGGPPARTPRGAQTCCPEVRGERRPVAVSSARAMRGRSSSRMSRICMHAKDAMQGTRYDRTVGCKEAPPPPPPSLYKYGQVGLCGTYAGWTGPHNGNGGPARAAVRMGEGCMQV